MKLIAVLASLLCANAYAATWTFVDSTVTFHGRAALVSVDGEKSTVVGSLVETTKGLEGVLVVDLKPFKTDNELRDSHLHQKYLETTKYPAAKLALKDVAFKDGAAAPWCGELTVKVDTQHVCGHYTLVGSNLEAEFTLDLAKIPSLGIPAWAGATMSDTVTVKIVAKVAKT